MGVYKNGESILDGVTAYSVAVTSGIDSTVVIVGVEGGVKVKEFGPMAVDSAWEDKAVEGSVYSVAVDPYTPWVVYAGSSSGFYVSRDGGATFADATPVEEDGSRPVVRSVAAVYTGDPNVGEAKFYAYLATESGVMRAYLENAGVGAAPPPPEGPQGGDPDAGGSDEPQGGDPDAGTSTPAGVTLLPLGTGYVIQP